MRVRGGLDYDLTTRRYQLVVHLWDDDQGRGDPDQVFAWPETYATEAEAETAYLAHVRPALVAIRQQIERTPGSRLQVHQWGFRTREEPR